jgi:hypothetical protein
MKNKITQALLCASLAIGCASTGPSPGREAVFSPEWADSVQKHQQKMQRRERKPLELGGPVGRALVYTDEKGKPQLGLKGPGGLTADVDMKGGNPEVDVGYRIDLVKPPKRMPGN